MGKRDVIGRIKKNPLNRALRIDKLTLAALEATIKHYLEPADALLHTKVLRTLREPLKEVEGKAERLLTMLRRASIDGVTFSLKQGKAMAGGGSLPTQEISTVLLSVKTDNMSAGRAEERLRGLDVPVIARISDDELLFDLRTVDEDEFPFIEIGLKAVAHQSL